jgi:exonuclease SbcC
VKAERLKQIDENEDPELASRIEALEQEKAQSEKATRRDALASRIAKLDSLKAKEQEAKEALEAVAAVTEADRKELTGLKGAVDTQTARLEAAKLTLRFEAKTEQEFSLVLGEAASEEHLAGGESIEREASGRLSMEHEGWSLTVLSGTDDIEAVIDEKQAKEARLQERLSELGVASVSEAEEAAAAYRARSSDLEHARRRLQEELGEDSYEALREELDALGELGHVRSRDAIVEELTRAQNQRESLAKERTDIAKQITQWKSDYGSQDELIDRLAEETGQKREIEKRLSELPELPEGFSSVEAFQQHVRSTREKLQAAEQEWNQAKQEKAKLEGSAPQESAEELVRRLRDAERTFARAKEEGEALLRVRAKTEELLAAQDRAVYDSYQARFLSYLARMTDSRFRTVAMQQELPSSFVTEEGTELSYQILSQGTKDTASLALRLAMAEHFLDGSTGFLLLDDPLVEMDPKRQELASGAIREFAGSHQIIFFTCNPGIASGLGGSEVEL